VRLYQEVRPRCSASAAGAWARPKPGPTKQDTASGASCARDAVSGRARNRRVRRTAHLIITGASVRVGIVISVYSSGLALGGMGNNPAGLRTARQRGVDARGGVSGRGYPRFRHAGPMSADRIREVPVLFLDVDGVVNLFDRIPPVGALSLDGYDDFEPADLSLPQSRQGRVTVSWSRRMVADLAALEVEMRWLTTWGSLASAVLCPLFGWPELEVAALPHLSDLIEGNVTWKVFPVIESVRLGRRVVWVDDEAIAKCRSMLARFLPDESPLLLIDPDPSVGLRPADLETIRRFVG
jgi:hypothetical protein